jgi:hypothetical protein
MSTYAVINNGIVTNIVVADVDWANAQTETIIEYTDENPAFVGGDYVDGLFYAPKPFASWTRSNGTWVAPVTMPTDAVAGHAYVWNEFELAWEDVEIPT